MGTHRSGLWLVQAEPSPLDVQKFGDRDSDFIEAVVAHIKQHGFAATRDLTRELQRRASTSRAASDAFYEWLLEDWSCLPAATSTGQVRSPSFAMVLDAAAPVLHLCRSSVAPHKEIELLPEPEGLPLGVSLEENPGNLPANQLRLVASISFADVERGAAVVSSLASAEYWVPRAYRNAPWQAAYAATYNAPGSLSSMSASELLFGPLPKGRGCIASIIRAQVEDARARIDQFLPTADDALIEEIAAHADDDLWMKIARLSVLPDAVWVRATQGAEQVRCALAENPSTPVAILMQLAADASITLQQSLVMNPNLPTALIAEMIARDRFSLMRAAHRQPNVEIQALIAQHDDAEVRRAVARNPAVHHSVVARLAYDPNDSVRESALHTCLAPWDVLPTLFGITLDMLDAHLRTTKNLPRGITRHPDARVRRAIVANPHASVHALAWFLVNDPMLLGAAAATTATTATTVDPELLALLVGHAYLGAEVGSVLRAPASPPELVEAAIVRAATLWLPARLYLEHRGSTEDARVAAASTPMDSEMLQELAQLLWQRDESARVRESIPPVETFFSRS